MARRPRGAAPRRVDLVAAAAAAAVSTSCSGLVMAGHPAQLGERSGCVGGAGSV